MKKFGFLALAFVLAIGLSSCEKKSEGDGETGNGTAGTETPATGNPTDGTNPAVNPAVNPAEQPAAPQHPLTTVEFGEESHNFGQIKQGEKVKHTFKFKNTGEHPVYVDNVKPSCGCTSPNWSKEAVQPGEEGFIEVEFNSTGKSGVQKKTVSVTMNVEASPKILSFSGEVVE